MSLTPEQARESLESAAAAAARMRQTIAYSGSGLIIAVWGVVWLVAFSLTQLWQEHPAWILTTWGIGNAAGVMASLVVGWGAGAAQKVRGPAQRALERRLFAFWLAVFSFLPMWIWLMQPIGGRELVAFVCTGIMFAYVVLGLWLEAWLLLVIGLCVTAATVLGYLLLPEVFYLWMAVMGGGALLVSGLHIHRKWK